MLKGLLKNTGYNNDSLKVQDKAEHGYYAKQGRNENSLYRIRTHEECERISTCEFLQQTYNFRGSVNIRDIINSTP